MPYDLSGPETDHHSGPSRAVATAGGHAQLANRQPPPMGEGGRRFQASSEGAAPLAMHLKWRRELRRGLYAT